MFHYVIVYMISINNVHFPPFFDNFYLVKSKMAANMTAILDDVTGPQQRPSP